MKIGLLLFGHLRTYQFCAPLLQKNLLQRYSCDVFISTWSKIDSETVSRNDKKNVNFSINEEIKKNVMKLYSPKKIFVGHQDIRDDIVVRSEITDKHTSLKGMNYMFESLSQANQLRKQYENETGISYDLIIATRPDIALFEPFPNLEKVNREALAINLKLSNVRFFAGLSNTSKTNVALMCHRGCDMLFWGHPLAIDTFIEANKCLTQENIKNSFYNICTVYAANEIKAGNIPQLVCFEYGKDWKNIRFNDRLLSLPKSKKSKLYKFCHLYWLRGKK